MPLDNRLLLGPVERWCAGRVGAGPSVPPRPVRSPRGLVRSRRVARGSDGRRGSDPRLAATGSRADRTPDGRDAQQPGRLKGLPDSQRRQTGRDRRSPPGPHLRQVPAPMALLTARLATRRAPQTFRRRLGQPIRGRRPRRVPRVLSQPPLQIKNLSPERLDHRSLLEDQPPSCSYEGWSGFT